MSPSSSAAAVPTHIRTRGSSNATPVQDPSVLKPSSRISSRPGSPGTAPPESARPNYTVFIRLPFPRGSFTDPAPVNWTAIQDRKLWKLISKPHDLDWEGLSQEFGIELEFLLMQAAWLSERHMERMRRQVTKIAGGGDTAESKPLPAPGSMATGPPLRRGSPALPAAAPASPTTEGPVLTSLPRISRTPSFATVTQSRLASGLPAQARRAPRGSSGSTRRPILTSTSEVSQEYYEDAIEHEGPSDSDSGDEPVSALTRSQLTFRRPPAKKKPSALNTLASDGDEEDEPDDGDDDDSSNGGYLPFAAASKAGDPAATVRGNAPAQQSSRPATALASARVPRPPVRTATESSQSSTTSSAAPNASSAAPLMARHLSPQPSTSNSQTPPQRRRASHESSAGPAHPLSPRHRAQLASLSPQSRREGSDGTPSMGSSFSDLDAESLNSSALEDALMSNMQRGGSTFSMAGTMAGRLGGALGKRGG